MKELPLDGTKVDIELKENFGASCSCMAPLSNPGDDPAKIAVMVAVPAVAAVEGLINIIKMGQ